MASLSPIAWIVLAGAVASCAAQATQSVVPAAMSRALQARIELWAQRDTHHGVSASVIFADGSQWSGAAGTAGDEPLTTEHLMQIGSITKTMTAAIVLQLVDENVVSLDDQVARWLPPIPNINPAITVRRLLNHTSGVGNYTGVGAALGRAIAADPRHVFTVAELLQYVGAPTFAPGESTEYTNTAFLLLGMIAERATGRSITELYRLRLFNPQGIDAVFMPGLEEPPGPVAVAYGPDGPVRPLDHLSLLSIGNSAFGMVSNAATVARWGRALFTGGVISEERQQEMRTLVPAAGNIRGETGSGLGIRGYEYLERRQFGHSGGATFGSSLLLFDPESGVTVVVLMNQGEGADHVFLAPALLELATRP